MSDFHRSMAERLRVIVAEMEAGHPVAPADIAIEARRLDARAEMEEEGLVE